MVVGSLSTVSLDHLYAKNETSLGDDVFSDEHFLNSWTQGNSNDGDDLLNLLFGEDFTALDNVSLPRSYSSSSDSYMTPSPAGASDDVELCEVVSSSSASPGLQQTSDDFNIDFAWTADFDFTDLNSSTGDQDLVTVTSSPPTAPAVTLSTITVNEPVSICPPTTICQRNKSSVLVLSSEEKRLLEQEGVVLPTDMPLTKAEEKVLKKVRRKIKNKQSAQESRRKKKDYVEGLEERVRKCTEDNLNLNKKMKNLEAQNKSLLEQLRELQTLVASTHPSKAQAGTCLMVLFLAFGLVLFPINGNNNGNQKNTVATYAPANVRSRTLLQVHDDYMAETDDVPEIVPFNVNNSDYLKAAPVTTETKTSIGKMTVAVSHVERRSQENEMRAEKR